MIGFIKENSADEELARILSVFSNAYHVPFCSFHSSAVASHISGEPLIADFWNGSGYDPRPIPLPEIIDWNRTSYGEGLSFSEDSPEGLWLRDHTKMLFQRSLSKEQLAVVLLRSPLVSYMIPTFPISSYSDLQSTVSYIRPAILKPSNGQRGKYVCRLDLTSDGKLMVTSKSGQQEFTEDTFLRYQKSVSGFRQSHVLLQPCLDFHYDDTHSLDFRLLRHRGATGKWEEAVTYARIGSNAITSNLSQGGFIAKPLDILNVIAGNDANQVYEEIMMLGEKVPLLVEEIYGDAAFCVGIDVGVDRKSLHPYIMETNAAPGHKHHIYHYAEKRVQYYSYLHNIKST